MASSPPQSQMLMTIPEVADELRVDQRTIYRLLRSGELPLQVLYIGRSSRVRRADLERYLTELAEHAEAEAAERQRQAAALVWGRQDRRRRQAI
jgi:excisionase family DNA binding protein